MDAKTFSAFFDHTALKSETTLADIRNLCIEAVDHQFFAVCLNPTWLSQAREFLQNSSVHLCTVVNFPLGASGQTAACAETEWALKTGAQEIDCVINVGALKSKDDKKVQSELNALAQLTRGTALLKVIVESGILTDDELRRAIDAVNISGSEFIKTSTGFAKTGATPQAIEMMKKYGRDGLKIKASGGIRTLQEAQTYIHLGVHRIGASQSVDILKEFCQ